MNEIVIKKLISDYKCHAVILYGSRARGDFSSESDWDYFELGEVKVFRLKNGVILHDERGEGASNYF
jgi:predicted nucleotidyltransferase